MKRLGTLMMVLMMVLPVFALPDSDRNVSMPWKEFSSMMDKVKQAEFEKLLEKIKPAIPPEGLPPADWTITHSVVDGTVKNTIAEFKATIVIKVLANKWVRIPLMSTDTLLRKATLNNAEVTLFEENRRYNLTTKKAGSYTLVLEMTVPVEKKGTAGNCRLSLPASLTTLLSVTLPGNSRNVVINPALVSDVRPSGSRLKVMALTGQHLINL